MKPDEFMKAADSVTIHVVGLGIKKVDFEKKQRPSKFMYDAFYDREHIDEVCIEFTDEVTFEVKRKTVVHRAIMKYSGKIMAVREFPEILVRAGDTFTIKFRLQMSRDGNWMGVFC